MFPIEGIELNLQEPEFPKALDLLVGQEGVGGQESQHLKLPAVLGQELDGFYVLPAVGDRQADQVFVSSEELLQGFLSRSRPLVGQIQVFTILIIVIMEEGILQTYKQYCFIIILF